MTYKLRKHQKKQNKLTIKALKKYNHVLSGAPTGMGKEQPYSEPVLTPFGWRTMGELKVGGYVIGGNGKPTEITHIHEQGKKRVYKINFQDKTYALCGKNHLWKIRARDNLNWITLPIKDMMSKINVKTFDKRSGKSHFSKRFRIPLLTEPTLYEKEIDVLPIEPRAFGILLGDGSFRNGIIQLSNISPVIREVVESCLDGFDVFSNHRIFKNDDGIVNKYDVSISTPAWQQRSNLRIKIEQLGLGECYSTTKFIPSMYKYSSPEDRQLLLQGLLETDGYITSENLNEYSTSSERLAMDVIELARGLGKYVTWSTRIPYFTHKGVKKQGEKSWRIYIRQNKTFKSIVNIEKLDYKEKSRCITVASEDSLYVTRGFNVTHNSIMMLDLIKKFLDDGQRILVIAPYRKLIFQLLDTFQEYSPALIMGTDSYGDARTSPVVVASLPTLQRRLEKDPFVIGGLNYIIIDEAHIAFNLVNNKPSKIISELHKRYWKTAKWIGFTATPITASGYRLEGWDYSIYKYSVRWLIKNGWLSKFTYYSTPDIDASMLKLNSATGDYNTKDMEAITNSAGAVGYVYKNYKKYGKNKKTLIFSASIEHAKLILEHFKKKGINSRVIHSMIKESEQKKILEEYKQNVFSVLINVSMLTTGFDDPEVETLIIARPIGSKRLAIQTFGRSLRKHKDIKKAIIVDMCSIYLRCGLPDDEHNWNREKPKKGDKVEDETPSIVDVNIECRSCKGVFRMIDSKRENILTKDLMETTYYCPLCGEIADIRTKELSKQVVTKIKTANDIDDKKKYTLVDIKQLLGEMIKMNTKAKTSWGHFIHRECVAKNRKGYELAYKGYDQGVFSNKQSWKRIMEIYGS